MTAFYSVVYLCVACDNQEK